MVIDTIIGTILVLCIAYNIFVVYIFKIKHDDNLFTIMAMLIGMIVFPIIALCANICCKG